MGKRYICNIEVVSSSLIGSIQFNFTSLAQLVEHYACNIEVISSSLISSIQFNFTSLAQLVEHYSYKVEVIGSIPIRRILIAPTGEIGKRCGLKIHCLY